MENYEISEARRWYDLLTDKEKDILTVLLYRADLTERCTMDGDGNITGLIE